MQKQSKEKAMHRSAWKGGSANFAITEFSEVALAAQNTHYEGCVPLPALLCCAHCKRRDSESLTEMVGYAHCGSRGRRDGWLLWWASGWSRARRHLHRPWGSLGGVACTGTHGRVKARRNVHGIGAGH